jgi:hypothetical protein
MRARGFLVLLALGAAAPGARAQAPAPALVGRWTWEALVDTEAVADGTIDVRQGRSGALSGMVEFGGNPRPVRVLSASGRAIRFDIVMADGTVPIEGTLLDDGTISGTWGYGECSGRFTARRDGRSP